MNWHEGNDQVQNVDIRDVGAYHHISFTCHVLHEQYL